MLNGLIGGSGMRLEIRTSLAIIALCFTRLVIAHHSTANFDFSKSDTVTGTVQYFSFTNPHSFIDLSLTDARGSQRNYKIFTVARVVMVRTGWALDDLKTGDKVTVTGNPDRKNPQFIYLTKIAFPSGKVWDRDPALQR
jgi:hypothetical protein